MDVNGKPCDYIFLDANPAFENYIGLSANKLLGKRASQVLPGIIDCNFNWIKLFGNVAINGGSIEIEEYFEPLKKYFKIKVFSPERFYFVTFFDDIDKEVQSFKNLENLCNTDLFMNCICSINGKIKMINNYCKNVLGVSSNEIVGKQFTDIVYKDDIKGFNKKLGLLKDNKQPMSFTIKLKTNNSELRCLECQMNISNNSVYIYGIDITEHINEKNMVLTLKSTIEEFFLKSTDEIDYNVITEKLAELTHAKYTVLNLYEGRELTTVAISGTKHDIIKAYDILGIDPLGKKWRRKDNDEEEDNLLIFNSLEELASDNIPKKTSRLISKTFGLGQIVISKIVLYGKQLGHFMIFLPKDQHFEFDPITTTYIKLVSLFLAGRYNKNLTDHLALAI